MAEENYRIYWTEKADGRGIIKKGKYLADNRNFLIGLSDKLHSTKYRLVEVRDEDNALGFKISETDNLFPEGAIVSLSRGEDPGEEMILPSYKRFTVRRSVEVPKQKIDELALSLHKKREEYGAKVQEIKIKHKENLAIDLARLGPLEDFLKKKKQKKMSS